MPSRLTAPSARPLLGALGLALLSAVSAGAQLSTPTFVNNSNPNELFLGTPTAPSYERETAVALASSSAGGAFVTRFSALVTADGDGGPGIGFSESLFADYQISFTATAPGAYRLTVATRLQGDLHLVNDGANGGSADIGPVSALATGGTIIGGGLGLPDAGAVAGASGGSSGIDESNTATIFAVSNGSAIPHTLRFLWSNSATTDGTPGDEAAVRLGGTSDVPSETAGDYPGSPPRTQADDGHVVSVTFESLCGNGVIDSGPSYTEQCDDGPDTGQPGSCCAANCTFASDGTSCDDGDDCTDGETCSTGVCRGGADRVCPLCQRCKPLGGCEIGPRTDCKTTTLPRKASLKLKRGTTETADSLSWKWTRGEETGADQFGTPLTNEDYAFCVFTPGDPPTLALAADVPAGGICGTRPCWKALDVRGFSYKDAARTPDGIDRLVLKAGLAGKAGVTVTGKGAALPGRPPLPLDLPAIVQVQAESGACWEGTFTTADNVSRNDSVQFEGKAD